MISENYFNDLPDELLLKIFDLSCLDNKGFLIDLTQVCRRWKEMIEYYHVFETLAYFNNYRAQEDIEIVLTSQRQFKSLKINLYIHNEFDYSLIGKILDKNCDTMQNVIIDSEDFWNTTLVSERPNKIPLEHFHNVLRSVQKIKKLTINFSHLYFEEKQLNTKSLDFPELKNLKVIWNRGEKTIGKHFMNLIRAPLLSVLKIDLQCLYGITDVNEFLDFILIHSSSLKDIYVSSGIYTFEWTESFMNIVHLSGIGSKILSFLEHRLDSLKEFKVHCIGSNSFIPSILTQAQNLEAFHTEDKISKFCSNKQYPSIKLLTTGRYMGQFGNEETFRKLSFNFPNIEILRFSCGDLSEHNKILILRYFHNLREIQIVKSDVSRIEKVPHILRQSGNL